MGIVSVVGVVGLSGVSGVMGLLSELCLVNFVCAVLCNVLSTMKHVCEHYRQYSNFFTKHFSICSCLQTYIFLMCRSVLKKIWDYLDLCNPKTTVFLKYALNHPKTPKIHTEISIV